MAATCTRAEGATRPCGSIHLEKPALARALASRRAHSARQQSRGECDEARRAWTKSFLFVHSEEARKELALLYSLVVSCTRVGVNPVEYLADVLARIDKIVDADEIAALLPHRWKPSPKPSDAVDFDS